MKSLLKTLFEIWGLIFLMVYTGGFTFLFILSPIVEPNKVIRFFEILLGCFGLIVGVYLIYEKYVEVGIEEIQPGHLRNKKYEEGVFLYPDIVSSFLTIGIMASALRLP